MIAWQVTVGWILQTIVLLSAAGALWWTLHGLHKTMNSRLDQLLEATRILAHAQGVEVGRLAEIAREQATHKPPEDSPG